MKDTITSVPGVQVVELLGADDAGHPLVAIDGHPTAARTVASAAGVDWKRSAGERAVVGFEDGDPARPIVLGVLALAAEGPGPAARVAGLHVDGRHPAAKNPEVVHLESERELVLRCGKAKISLSADGRVEILGGYLISRSSGVNKIKGGAVHIN
jgi:hypothetical protein